MNKKSSKREKVAILFRYGAEAHVDFLPGLPELVRGLGEQCAVHHFGFRGDAATSALEGVPMRVHRFPFRVRRGLETDKRAKLLLWLAILPWLGLYLRIRGFKAVFMDETLPMSVFLLRLSYRGALALTVHDSFLEMYFGEGHRLRKSAAGIQKLDLRSWRRVDRFFVRVESARRHLVSQGFPDERIQVAYDPGDLNRFAPQGRDAARKKWGFSENAFVLVHHGVMHPNKGNERIVRAVARLRERIPEIRLMLIGEGPEAERVADQVRMLGLSECVRCTGWLGSLDEVAEALNAADAGLAIRVGLTGDHFHITSTLVHNLCCGLPVIAARLEGMMEIVTDGQEGFLVDPACGEDFDQAVLAMSENPELRGQMSVAARRTAERCFDRQRIGREMAEGLLSLFGLTGPKLTRQRRS